MVSATEILSTSALNQPLSKFLLCEATTVYKAFHAWAGLHQQSFLHRQCRSTSGNAENSQEFQVSCHQLLCLFNFWPCLDHRTIGQKRPLRSSNPKLVFSWLPNYPCTKCVTNLSSSVLIHCLKQQSRDVIHYPFWSCLFPLFCKALVPTQTDSEEELGSLLVALGCSSLDTFDAVFLVIFKSCVIFPQQYQN